MRRFLCRCATYALKDPKNREAFTVVPCLLILYEDEVVARIAPDPQQDPFVLGVLRQSRRVRSVPDFLLIDGLNNIPGPETCLCGH
jgi:hypothetical protein